LVESAKEAGARLYDVITSPEKLQVGGRTADKVRLFGRLLGELSPALELPARGALELVISRSGLRAMYAGQADVDSTPGANLDELVSAASVFQEEYPDATVLDWLEQTALISDIDGVRGDTDAVTLMTLHAAKGLEFDRVYLIGIEDGLLPFRRRDDDSNDEEEERRLLFVGMTRARRQLTLSRARYRMTRGITERTTRSPFLDELPRDEVEWTVPEVSTGSGERALGRARLPDDITEWTVGTLVRHPRHGLGQVLSLQRGAKRTHADVQFKDGSRRSWVLEFAQLERVDFDDIG
ncbi:MAG: ATP-binding domain-containing protein, partial [Planctomycetes bacterium]|nr:ATP-binding domain-containing protein [Planctomycetota bacterium]